MPQYEVKLKHADAEGRFQVEADTEEQAIAKAKSIAASKTNDIDPNDYTVESVELEQP